MNIEFNESVLNRLAALERKGRLAHAYLFIGSADAGKGETALAAAKVFNCEDTSAREKDRFCGRCSSCVKIDAGAHPDVHVIDGGAGETIKIEQVRGLLDQMKLKPLMSAKKIFIIRSAENLTLEGANALLKTLEEPAPSGLLLLTTSDARRNLDTIRSRCQAVYFPSVSRAKLAAALSREGAADDRQACFLAYFADGCAGKARKLLQQGICRDRDEAVARFILGGGDGDFLKKILSDKQKTGVFLDIVLSWMRDCLLLKAGVPAERLIHADRISEIRDFQRRFSFKELAGLYAQAVETCRLLGENLNVRIPLMIMRESLDAA